MTISLLMFLELIKKNENSTGSLFTEQKFLQQNKFLTIKKNENPEVLLLHAISYV